MTIKEIRDLLGISRAEFARRYRLPIRTLENWEADGDNHREPPEWVTYLLEKVVRADME